MLRRLTLAVPVVLLLTACQATGQGFNIVPESQEAEMGAEAHPDILKEFGGAYDDPAVQAYVAGIGQRLSRASATPRPISASPCWTAPSSTPWRCRAAMSM